MKQRLIHFQESTRKVNWGVILALYLVQIVLFQIMNSVTFPVIQEHLGGLKMFDMRKNGYDVSMARQILRNIGEQGRHSYLMVQMPLDFIYPCVMATVYYLVLVKTSVTFRYSYYLFPALLVVFDWMENCCIILMLNGYPLSRLLVTWSSTCTQLKSLTGDYILYFAAIVWLGVYLVRVIITRGKRKGAYKER